LLAVTDVEKAFGGTHALSAVSLEANAGEVHALLGENGAGKSTLMKILAGAIRPDGGSMRLGGESYAPADPVDARRRGVAIVYQEPQLCPHLSVAENIALGVEPTRFGFVARQAMRERAERALKPLLGGDGHVIHPDTLVAELSAGDRQLCAIGRALGQSECRVLILDEPTSSLTADDGERLFAAVATLRQRGLCVIYISHFLEEVERIADRYTVLRDGRSVGKGVVAGTPMSAIVAQMVGDASVAPAAREEPRRLDGAARGEPRRLDGAARGEPRRLDGAAREEPRRLDGAARGEVLLELAGVAGRTKPIAASLELRRGDVLGIAGLVGSGRTELLRAIFGLDPVRAGVVKVGVHLGPASPVTRLRQRVGMLSEDRKGEGLAAMMSIADNLTLSKLEGLGPAGLISPARKRAAAERWIARLGIRCRDSEQPIADLSGGNQQKVALARLLYHDVDVLLLDEPTRGIDVRSRGDIHALLGDLARAGKAVLVVSSYLPELMTLCDRIAVMRRGRLGPARPTAELDEHALLSEASGADAGGAVAGASVR
jgi:ribose transport system ATP-binding protein